LGDGNDGFGRPESEGFMAHSAFGTTIKDVNFHKRRWIGSLIGRSVILKPLEKLLLASARKTSNGAAK
jgi:hypothetical protein